MIDARTLANLTAVTVTALWSTAALASDRHEQLLQRLGSPQYAVRQAATSELLVDASLTDQEISTLFTQATTWEQRHRLLSVARHHLVRSLRRKKYTQPDKGSIGIVQPRAAVQQAPHGRRTVVRVIRTLPGFPAHEQLQSGDLIVAVDDQPIAALSRPGKQSALSRSIEAKQAGQTVRLTVQRGQKTMELRLRLASLQALQRMYVMRRGTATLNTPVEHRWQQQRAKLMRLAAPVRLLTVKASAAQEPDSK